jgi:hypothetical protein
MPISFATSTCLKPFFSSISLRLKAMSCFRVLLLRGQHLNLEGAVAVQFTTKVSIFQSFFGSLDFARF